MKTFLPDRDAAEAKGWTHQVQWMEYGRPCFIRCTSGAQADAEADALKKVFAREVQVIDLRDALQIH